MNAVHTPEIKIGVVDFFNATPLIQGVSGVDGIQLIHKVPSKLIGCLERSEVDFALASSIDYQSSTEIGLGILPVGVLSSDGDSLTVQLCSRIPLEDVTEVHCDSDSHTSIALLQIILKNKFNITPTIVPTEIRDLGDCNAQWPDTVLIIGDKVVQNNYETEYAHTIDLGNAWKQQTNLPFVFAIWLGRMDLQASQIQKASMILQRQMFLNQHRIEQVVSANAIKKGWSTSQGIEYVTKHMYYSFEDQHIESLQLFYTLAQECGILKNVRPLHMLGS
jgi:chorismate dehydratase